jgi:hypothetical protein
MENIDISPSSEITSEYIRVIEFEARTIAAESRVNEMVKKLRALFTEYKVNHATYQYVDKKYLPTEAYRSFSYSSYSDLPVPADLRVVPDRNTMFDFGKLKKYIDEVIAIKPVDPWNQIYDVAKTGATFDREMENAYRTRVHELTEKLAKATADMNRMSDDHTQRVNCQTAKHKRSKNALIAEHKQELESVIAEHTKKLAAIELDHKKFVAALYLKLKPDYSAYTARIIQLNEELLIKEALLAEKTAENLKVVELKQQFEQSQAQVKKLNDQLCQLADEKKKLADKLTENTKLTNELINKLAAANEDVVYLNEKLTAAIAVTATTPNS